MEDLKQFSLSVFFSSWEEKKVLWLIRVLYFLPLSILFALLLFDIWICWCRIQYHCFNDFFFFAIFYFLDPHKIKKFREILMELRRRHHKLWWIIYWLLLPFNCCCCCHYNFILNLRFVLLILTTLLKFSFFFSYSWWTDVGWCWCCCWQIIIKYLYKISWIIPKK